MARDTGGEVASHRPSPKMWEMLKPLARQMRRQPTGAENALWQALRNRKLQGHRFRRQHAIERFIVDFYCREADLVLEVDGPIHDYQPQEDALRQEYLQSLGLRVLRFGNEEVLGDLEGVLARIARCLPHPPTPSPQSREGESEVEAKGATPLSPPHAEGATGVETPTPLSVPRGEVSTLLSLPNAEGNPEIPTPLSVLRRGAGGEVDMTRGTGGEVNTTRKFFTPEDLFHYIYAILHSPSYRQRYAQFLKIDFPRIPLTSQRALFFGLAELGRELVSLHLVESRRLNDLQTSFPETGDNIVVKVRYVQPKEGQAGRVYINKTQYFQGVPPEAWEFMVGGYQVLHKWLKDRRKRQLSFDELLHYQKIVVALCETMRRMEQVDSLIEQRGGWPLSG